MVDVSENQELLKSLPQIALKKIRMLCKGNGANPDSVQIKSAEGRMIDCQALTHLEVHPDFKDESKRGAHQIGEVCDDGSSMEQAVQQYVSGLMSKGGSRQAMVDVVKRSPGQGFGSHAEYFDIEPFNKDYCFQQTCEGCAGQAVTVCQSCNGQAKERCGKCHGQTMMPCNYCHARGTMRNAQGQEEQCRHCAGRRQIPCTICRRTGFIACRNCRGSGQVKCGNCDGAGMFTYVRHIIVKVKTLFEVDRAELPHPAVKVIEEAGPVMVKRGHIKLSQAEDVAREDGGLAIQYQAHFPYGDLEVSINGKSLKTHLFGFKAKMLKLPPFLEELTEKNKKYLQQAATQVKDASQNIRKAASARLFAQALLFSAMYKPREAMKALKKKFPMGVSNTYIKQSIALSNQALLKVTQSMRMTGYVVVSLMLSVLFFVYFYFLRYMLLDLLPLPILSVAIDIIVVALGSVLAFISLQKLLQRPLNKALSHIVGQEKRQAFKPKTQLNFLIFIALSASIFIGISILGVLLSLFQTPIWLPL